ncbi:ERAD-associated E3 ubiquitin-protein ligase HRD1B isoform X1 [Solanum lycopersicum]|uniref:RING-type E3 ubiquitin transferase n=2 Tax=Solanum lycopersicum TaxID=4081 RepID=A0A3Q7H1V6_SOLLC|nr:ERAD-associated E3 ubiquitin-protein ligase HRD1B isoform X1 [Solanum lycopersicum]
MMRVRTYAWLSVIASLAVIYHAFNSRGQFYPAMVYLSTSKISLVLLLNMGLATMCILWQLTKKIFLGTLRESEVERLNEQSWRELMEILFAITIFRQDFSMTFITMVTALFLVKTLHWLAQKRVEYIETTPAVTKLSHIRIVSFMGFLLLIDSLLLYNYMNHLIQTRQASGSLFFAFEYMILATTTVATFVKYVFYVRDMLMEGQWERKAVYTFYLELLRDLIHLTMYMCFFLMIFINYGVPLHLIRELYETFRNFKTRVADYIRYRNITSNMNDRFPDATLEELNGGDTICIICREEMTTAKKLTCGHLFHVNCLRSWLERQNTCPTCRALVVPPENGTSVAGSGYSQQGTSLASTSRGSQADPRTNGYVSQHQARLQAAVAAAAIYEKSFVYPSAPTLSRSHGHALFPPSYGPVSFISVDSQRESAANEWSQQHQYANMPFAYYPQSSFGPLGYPGANMPVGDGSRSNLSTSDTQLEAHRIFLQQQCEALQNQLKLLQSSKTQKVADGAKVSESKGKAISLENAQNGQAEGADF